MECVERRVIRCIPGKFVEEGIHELDEELDYPISLEARAEGWSIGRGEGALNLKLVSCWVSYALGRKQAVASIIQESKVHLGQRTRIQAWRRVRVSIDRRFLQGGDGEDGEDELDLYAGHLPVVANQVCSDVLCSLSEHSVPLTQLPLHHPFSHPPQRRPGLP